MLDITTKKKYERCEARRWYTAISLYWLLLTTRCSSWFEKNSCFINAVEKLMLSLFSLWIACCVLFNFYKAYLNQQTKQKNKLRKGERKKNGPVVTWPLFSCLQRKEKLKQILSLLPEREASRKRDDIVYI